MTRPTKLRFEIAACAITIMASVVACAGSGEAPTQAKSAENPCDSIAVITYENYGETVSGIRALYVSGKFDALEAALACLLTDPRRFQSGRMGSSALYNVFRTAMPAPGADPKEALRLKQWRAERPDSMFLEFAELRFKYSMAWNARGGAYAAQVPEAAWKGFREGLAATEKSLLSARKDLRDTPIWHHLLLAVVMDTDKSRAEGVAIFEEGVKRWPQYYDLYELVLTRMVPKWGGSWEAVDAFVKMEASQLQPLEGDSMYARLYRAVAAGAAEPHETLIVWPRMKASLEELVRRYPDPVHKNAAASFACAYRDATYFSAAMATISPGELLPSSWLPGTAVEPCTRLAASAGAAAPDARVLSPTDGVAGVSQADLTIRWWQWAASFEYNESPVSDTTGERCSSGQEGPVWFLAGTYGSSARQRTCHVPAGKYLFFPLINYVVMPSSCGGCALTCESASAQARHMTDDPMGLFAELDGRTLSALNDNRLASPACFDLAARTKRGPKIEPSASNGYWLLLAPLQKGRHTLRFGGSLPSLRQELIYTLEVE